MRKLTLVAAAAMSIGVVGWAVPATAVDEDPVWLTILQDMRLDPAEIGAGLFGVVAVSPEMPFGDIAVDALETDMAATTAFLLSLGASQAIELIQRCYVVASNATHYQAQHVSFCHAVFTAVRGGPAVVPVFPPIAPF